MDAAWRLSDGWQQGVDAVVADCLYGGQIAPCPPDSETPEPVEFQTVESTLFRPTMGVTRMKCSALSRGDRSPLATAVWQRHLDYMLAAELVNGTFHPDGTKNPNLLDSPVIAAPSDLASALACLEAFAATTLRGGPATIHFPPEQAYDTAGTNVGLMSFVRADASGALYTAAGTRVVVDPAYSGLLAAYVSGPVRIGYGDTPESVTQTVDTTDNTVYLEAWGPLLVVIDQCATAQVTLSEVTCTAP